LAHLRRYKQLQFEPSDITNLSHCHSACQGIDIVLHQAALGYVPRSILYPDATHAANVTGFINMLIAAKEAKVKRVVYASSSSVYGNDTHWPKTEQFTGTPLSPYAATKAMNEMYADIKWSYEQLLKASSAYATFLHFGIEEEEAYSLSFIYTSMENQPELDYPNIYKKKIDSIFSLVERA
jgi:nucleoside-diphosphate-sugar epimerase